MLCLSVVYIISMDDSVFHIVEKLNGEIEIVQLKTVKIKNNLKLTKEVSSPECDKPKESEIKVKHNF